MNLADVFVTICYMGLGAVILFLGGEYMTGLTKEGTFIFMSAGLLFISVGFIRYCYKFFKTKHTESTKEGSSNK